MAVYAVANSKKLYVGHNISIREEGIYILAPAYVYELDGAIKEGTTFYKDVFVENKDVVYYFVLSTPSVSKPHNKHDTRDYIVLSKKLCANILLYSVLRSMNYNYAPKSVTKLKRYHPILRLISTVIYGRSVNEANICGIDIYDRKFNSYKYKVNFPKTEIDLGLKEGGFKIWAKPTY